MTGKLYMHMSICLKALKIAVLEPINVDWPIALNSDSDI